MSIDLTTHLDCLKKALLELEATGHDGFEGLLATVFGALTRRTFRLAGSGSQHGKDGSTAESINGIAFEAKLYTGPINKNEVLGKLTEIIAAQPSHDLWVLGATIEIKTQIIDQLSKAAEKNGVNFLALDWSPTAPLPLLAVACALAPDETAAFLAAHVADATLTGPAVDALLAVASHADFAQPATGLRAALSNPGVGLPIAVEANHKWLTCLFADERAARSELGQPLAPLADNALRTVKRRTLVQRVQEAAFGTPVDEIVVLLGDEGCGKSWIFAQSWIEAENPPLALVVSAGDVPDRAAGLAEWEFLAQEVIRQTGGSGGADQWARARWNNVFDGWSSVVALPGPNLVVLIDGLNQRPDFGWSQFLDRMAIFLARVGGRLVVSVRSRFYDERLRDSLVAPRCVLPIESWTETELREILGSQEIDASQLKQRVIDLLRNPRVLGIAFELLRKGSIEAFSELSIERLLFEHVRKSAQTLQLQESPRVFIHRLSMHAQEILDRVRTGDPLSLFDFESADMDAHSKHRLTQGLLDVSGRRFFSSSSEDPYFYRLTKDGLEVALGFAILDAMAGAQRTGADIDETLGGMLEPIAALDRTAEAVFAALTLSTVDERSEDTWTRSLIVAFLQLQNVDERDFPPFNAIVRARPEAAMSALATLYSSNRHVTHADWLAKALRNARRNPDCWGVIGGRIDQWLRTYSLDPKPGVIRQEADSVERYEAKVAERERALVKRVNELSCAEAEFLAKAMSRDDALTSGALTRQTFYLLAGMPLAPFAEALVARALSLAINSGFHAPYEELIHLVRFNTVDWAATRDSLLKSVSVLCGSDPSEAGRWAQVHVLRATGTTDDSARCDKLVEALVIDRPTFPNWRLVETYCDTDPCDPKSTPPSTIEDTVSKYQEIDSATIGKNLGMSRDDHLFRDAGVGLARFEPGAAIAVHRQVLAGVCQDVSHRDAHRILNVREDVPLVTPSLRDRLLSLANSKSGPCVDGDEIAGDENLIAQHALLLAFPHMDGEEQLDFLVSLPRYGPPLFSLAEVLNPAAPELLEAALKRCTHASDDDMVLTILMVARYSGSHLSEQSRAVIRDLARSENSAVRGLAIDALVYADDRSFLSSFAKGEWDANKLDQREANFERWNGAQALARSVELELIDPLAALDRVAPEHYHLLALAGRERCGSAISARVDAAFLRTVKVDPPVLGPTVEQKSDDARQGFASPLLSLVEPRGDLGPEEFFKRLSEGKAEFRERQRLGWEAFRAFEASLTQLDAQQILHDRGLKGSLQHSIS